MQKLIALGLLFALVPGAFADAPGARPTTREAVARASEYLKKAQGQDGSWSGLRKEDRPAITALSVLALLSAGHVPGRGPYGDTVSKGVTFVMSAQQDDGLLGTPGPHEMYQHGICTLLLLELAPIADEKLAGQIRPKLAKAIRLTLRAQRQEGNGRGGWRYRVVGLDADLSVSGWQLVALHAASAQGLEVPGERIDQALEFVKKLHEPISGGFRYTPHGAVTSGCTADGLLCLLICGQERNSPQALRARDFLTRQLPRWEDNHCLYSIFHGSHALCQFGGESWEGYRKATQALLLEHQEADGSWLAGQGEGRIFGRNLCTALSVLSLTVEDRRLRIYQRSEPARKPAK